MTVSWVVFLQKFGTGQQLFLSPATNINGKKFVCLLFRFPWNQSELSFFFKVFKSVFKFLPAFDQAEQVLAFFSKSARMFGHQKKTASLHILLTPWWPKCNGFNAAICRLYGTIMRSSTIVIPSPATGSHLCQKFVVVRDCQVLLCSRQHRTSIKSGSAAVSLMRVSKSSMKPNSEDRILSFSCCLFSEYSIYPHVKDSHLLTWAAAGLLDNLVGIACVMVGSSSDDEIVNSVSCLNFCVLIMSGFVSVDVPGVGGTSSSMSLKYPPPRCVSRHSSFLRRRLSIHFTSLQSPSSGLLGRRNSLSSFLCHC